MPGTHVAFTDSFDRANEGSPPSASWTDGITAFVDGLAVVSNACTQENAAGAFRQGSYWNVADFGPDTEVGCRLSAWTNAVNNELWMFVRLQTIGAGTTTGYSLRLEGTAGSPNWFIARTGGGDLAGPVAQAVAVGDWVAFRAIGTALSGWYSSQGGVWTQIVSATDSTHTAAGKVGFEITNNQDTRFDDFWALTVPPVETKILRPVTTPLRF